MGALLCGLRSNTSTDEIKSCLRALGVNVDSLTSLGQRFPVLRSNYDEVVAPEYNREQALAKLQELTKQLNRWNGCHVIESVMGKKHHTKNFRAMSVKEVVEEFEFRYNGVDDLMEDLVRVGFVNAS